ncbi:MAG: Xanthine phosphoribosyltransferase [Desulfovibrio sp.]
MATSDRYTKWFKISWDQLHKDSKTLARELSAKGPFSSIVAVTRGGLVPAAVIARELDIRLVDTLCISSYDWQSQTDGSASVLKGVPGTGVGCLVIDDLVDTGKTARVVRQLLPDAHFATVYVKPEGKSLVDTFIGDVSQDTWILFPWDSELQYVKPLAKCDETEQGNE